MSDLKEEFMAAALQSAAANPEKKIGLWRWLGEMIGTADERSLKETIRRWQEVDAGGDRRWMRKTAMGLLAFAAIFGALSFPHPASDALRIGNEFSNGRFKDNSLSIPR